MKIRPVGAELFCVWGGLRTAGQDEVNSRLSQLFERA